MANKLYVGGLSFKINDETLKSSFELSGTVESVQIITDRQTGRSRGFGFVEMASDEEAAAAIEMWNGKELEGRTLVINEARPLSEKPRRDFSQDRNRY